LNLKSHNLSELEESKSAEKPKPEKKDAPLTKEEEEKRSRELIDMMLAQEMQDAFEKEN
jgi:hypothetical protein